MSELSEKKSVVSRSKYNSLKQKSINLFEDFKNLQNELKQNQSEFSDLKKKSEKEKKIIEIKFKDQIKNLKNEFKDNIFEKERIIIKLEAKNDALSDRLNYVKQHYTEVKEDYRDHKKWARTLKKRSP